VVQAEMLHDLVHSVEPGHRIALDVKSGAQVRFCQSRQNIRGAPYRRAQLLQKGSNWTDLPFGKLGGRVSGFFHQMEGGTEPLTHVAVQVKDQVADAVAGFVGPPPDLLVGE